jgi:hypothetical protein
MIGVTPILRDEGVKRGIGVEEKGRKAARWTEVDRLTLIFPLSLLYLDPRNMPYTLVIISQDIVLYNITLDRSDTHFER